MHTLIICIIVFLVLGFITEKTLGGKSIGSVFRWYGSWYEICNSTRGFSIFFKKEPNEYNDRESSYKCYSLSLSFFRISIFIYFNFIKKVPKSEKCYGFGFYSVDGEYPHQIIYCLGKSYQFKDLPWAFDFEDMNYFNVQDRKWISRKEYDEIELVRKCSVHEMPEFIFIDKQDTFYIIKSKDVQITDVTGVIVKRRWRRLIFKWLRIPYYYTKTDLDCYFNPDIGDKKGTWKGGVVGYDIKIPNYDLATPDYLKYKQYAENIEDILDKFMKEDRKF